MESRWKAFNFAWGRRVLGRGAVVLIISDGWDRGDVDLLGREMARLKRNCHRLIWLNPLLGAPDYEPLTAASRRRFRILIIFCPYITWRVWKIWRIGWPTSMAGPMEADMRDILSDLDNWRAENKSIALATVIQTWGSSPRRAGAKMALTPDGKITDR